MVGNSGDGVPEPSVLGRVECAASTVRPGTLALDCWKSELAAEICVH